MPKLAIAVSGSVRVCLRAQKVGEKALQQQCAQPRAQSVLSTVTSPGLLSNDDDDDFFGSRALHR